MKVYSNNAVSKDDLLAVDAKQSKQIVQLRGVCVLLFGALVANLALSVYILSML